MAGIADLAQRAGVDAALVRRFLDVIKQELEDGGQVRLKGLGTLSTDLREAKVFQTPVMKGETSDLPAELVVRWRTSDLLRKKMRDPAVTGANPAT
jgi:nucleoid DNA-binding protein